MATRVTDGARRKRLPPSFRAYRGFAAPARVHCSHLTWRKRETARSLYFPQRPVRRLNLLLCQEWCQYLEKKKKRKMPVGKRDIITCYFFQKKTWIEENADWICSEKTLLRVFVWVSPLKTLKCSQTKKTPVQRPSGSFNKHQKSRWK